MNTSPFDSIESAQEFLDLLIEAVNDTTREVKSDIERISGNQEIRHKQALFLVSHQLNLLSRHLANSRRILNDLRSLRRLLLNERRSAPVTSPIAAMTATQGSRPTWKR